MLQNKYAHTNFLSMTTTTNTDWRRTKMARYKSKKVF